MRGNPLPMVADNYAYMDPELINLLHVRCAPYIP